MPNWEQTLKEINAEISIFAHFVNDFNAKIKLFSHLIPKLQIISNIKILFALTIA